MDAIAETGFESVGTSHDDTPSLLAVIIETLAGLWRAAGCLLNEALESVLVALNAHLATGTGHQVVVLASGSELAEWLYPRAQPVGSTLANPQMYSQFKHVDEQVMANLAAHLARSSGRVGLALPGALSTALAYISKLQQQTAIKLRLLVVLVNDDRSLGYIPTMNCIFAAQKLKTAVDVCQLGPASSFLQQAADATGGVYLPVAHRAGLIQYLVTAFFVDTALRPFMVLPSQSTVDFRASCFLTLHVVDRGYVCGVCLCILEKVPAGDVCPVCGAEWDRQEVRRLRGGKPRPQGVKRKAETSDTALPTSPKAPVPRQ